MKRMDLFCSSPASTVICTSLDHRSVVRHSTRPHPHHHADHAHHLPHGGDLRRMIKTHVPIPCTSYQMAITPRPKSHCNDCKRIGEQDQRKNSADDLMGLSPPCSSRYLLSDKPLIEPISELNRSTTLVPIHPAKHSISPSCSPPLKASSYPDRPREQVVVLRVSLHCKGCESKVRKHLSRMEGVRSFSIDFEKKKVTVKGELSPLSVLASVSRVMKTTQLLWPSPSTSFSSSSSSS